MPRDCWKVVHKRDNVETVYLVSAEHSRDARREVRAHLYPEHACDKDCSWSTQPFRPEPPYMLYAINTATGAMSHPHVANEQSMCFVCLGKAAG